MHQYNNELMSHYLNMDSEQTISTLKNISNSNIVAEDPIKVMNSMFPLWSMEIIEQEKITDSNGTSIHCTVALYLPGIVRVGSAECKLCQYSKGNLFSQTQEKALCSAIRLFGIEIVDKKNSTEGKSDINKTLTQNYTPQSKASSMQHMNIDDPLSTTNSSNVVEEHNPPMDLNENRQDTSISPNSEFLNTPNVNNTNLQQNNKMTEDTPMVMYRPDQIEAIKAIKENNGLTTRNMLLSYFTVWDKTIQTVEQMYRIPLNKMDEFIQWYNSDGPLSI